MAGVIDRVRAAVSGDDAERFEKRREIKKKLASLDALRKRAEAMATQMRHLDQRADAAADRHSEFTGPIQARLREIDSAFAEQLLDDQELSPKLVREQADLLTKLSEANSQLEIECAAIKKTRSAIEKERGQLLAQLNEYSNIRAQLSEPGIANRKLVIQSAVARNDLFWSQKQVRAAEQDFQTLNDHYKRIVKAREKSTDRELRPDGARSEERAAFDADVAAAQLDAARQRESAALAAVENCREKIYSE